MAVFTVKKEGSLDLPYSATSRLQIFMPIAICDF
jgi:hypothetical protein